MDTNFNPTPSEAHPETMDFLSRAWCNFAVQALQPAELQDRSVVPLDNSIKKFDQADTKVPFTVSSIAKHIDILNLLNEQEKFNKILQHVEDGQ